MAASVPPFDEKVESWECYQERLENYFIASDIVDVNKKKAILLNSVGPGTYERLRNICYPSAVSDRLYDELLELFNQLFSPAIIVFKERKQFYNARKKPTEKAAAWHERLCRLALNCKFGMNSQDILRDKFVTSFEGSVFEKFCNAGVNITLNEALEIAKTYETLDTAPKPFPYPKPFKPAPQGKNAENPQKDKKPFVHKDESNPRKQFVKKKAQEK